MSFSMSGRAAARQTLPLGLIGRCCDLLVPPVPDFASVESIEAGDVFGLGGFERERHS